MSLIILNLSYLIIMKNEAHSYGVRMCPNHIET